MAIFKYEMRQIRFLVAVWAVVCAALVFALFPGFVGIVIDESGAAKTNVLESVDSNSFLQAVDVSADFLSKPIGMYGFITGWLFGLAFAVIAMHLGLSIHTKEYLFKSADFLLTKPFSRTKVFAAKLLAVVLSILAIGVPFWLASLAALNIFAPGFDFKLFTLLSCAPILNMTLYLSIGIFAGAVWPKIRKPLLASVLTMFVTVTFGSLAQVTGTDILLFLSPPKFFGGSIVAAAGGYDMRFVVWIIFLDIALLVSSLIVYRKKDVVTV
jgi:ABC-2 type transport system permease protein